MPATLTTFRQWTPLILYGPIHAIFGKNYMPMIRATCHGRQPLSISWFGTVSSSATVPVPSNPAASSPSSWVTIPTGRRDLFRSSGTHYVVDHIMCVMWRRQLCGAWHDSSLYGGIYRTQTPHNELLRDCEGTPLSRRSRAKELSAGCLRSCTSPEPSPAFPCQPRRIHWWSPMIRARAKLEWC